MSELITRRGSSECRVCNSRELESILDLGSQPLPAEYGRTAEEDHPLLDRRNDDDQVQGRVRGLRKARHCYPRTRQGHHRIEDRGPDQDRPPLASLTLHAREGLPLRHGRQLLADDRHDQRRRERRGAVPFRSGDERVDACRIDLLLSAAGSARLNGKLLRVVRGLAAEVVEARLQPLLPRIKVHGC